MDLARGRDLFSGKDLRLQRANAYSPICLSSQNKNNFIPTFVHIIYYSLGYLRRNLGRILYTQREKVESRKIFFLCNTAKMLSGGTWLF